MTFPVERTTILVERSGDVFIARVKDDPDANLVFAGKTAAEAVGRLVIVLAPSLKLRVIQKD